MIRIECQKAFDIHMQEAYDNSGEVDFEYFASNLCIEDLEKLWHDACLWQLEQVKEAIRKL